MEEEEQKGLEPISAAFGALLDKETQPWRASFPSWSLCWKTRRRVGREIGRRVGAGLFFQNDCTQVSVATTLKKNSIHTGSSHRRRHAADSRIQARVATKPTDLLSLVTSPPP